MPALSSILIGAGAATGIAGAVISSNAATEAAEIQGEAAGSAAEAQVQAAQIAAEQQQNALEESIAFQQGIFDVGQENLAPFLQAGQGAVGTLADLLAPESEFLQGVQEPFEFEFGLDEFEQDPGFQFRLQQGEQALNRAASARGNLISGGQLRDLAQFNQEFGAQEFGVARSRALQEQSAEFESARGGRLDVANLLSNLAGLGQTTGQVGAQAGAQLGGAGGQTLAQIGQVGAQGTLQAGQATAGGLINAANAAAAGQVGQANAANLALGAIGQAPFDALLLQALLGSEGQTNFTIDF